MNTAALPLAPSALSPLAQRLGLAGLLPFALGALLVWLLPAGDARRFVVQALCLYAGVISSFLGAVHWGLAMRQATPQAGLLGWGATVPLIAWVAMLMHPHAGLVILGLLLVGCYLVDRRVYPREGVAHWLTLRFRLSAGAALSCFIGAAGA
jgi:hypothetical protein